MSSIMNERPRARSSSSLFRVRSGSADEKNPTCAGVSHQHSRSTPSARPPPPRPSSSRRSSFSQSTSFIWSGQAPSSFIEPEARSSNTLSRQDSTRSSAQSQRDSLFSLGRFSIVSDPRPSLDRRSTTASARQEFGETNKPWSHKSALKRISWGWNQTFAGLTPQEITEVEFQRGRGTEVNIPRTPSYQDYHRQRSLSEGRTSRPSTAHSTTSNTSAQSDASTIIPSGSSTVNKPFANRRPSVARAPAALPPVTEEEPHPEAIDETDEMGLGRSITKRFQRMSSNGPMEKPRPVIGLPSLISTTNCQVTDAYEVHPALRDSGSSNDYSNSTCPATPNSETPGLTDSSSIGSSRSSTNGSPVEGHFKGPIEPNHLTQYFPQLAPEKVCDNVVIRANSISEDDVFISGPAPALPTRAASHSKREHERLAKSRSLRSSTGSYSSRHTSASAGETQAFANGLAQVEEAQEVQEEFEGPALETTITNDEKVMNKGFRSFTPSVYMLDLADMEATRWIDEAGRRSVTA